MAAAGEILTMPDFAVFADVGDEPLKVYQWLATLKTKLPFPVYTATSSRGGGKLSDHILKGKTRHSVIPVFNLESDGSKGFGKRQYTTDYKIIPIHRMIREITHTQNKHLPAGFVTQWKGISIDEISRAKDSREPWITNRYPLIEIGMSRRDCEKYLKKFGYSVPKSSCVFCPYKSDRQWRETKNNPAEWETVLKVQRQLKPGEFLHKSMKPIEEVDFSTEEERGQLNMFNNECEGMCGV